MTTLTALQTLVARLTDLGDQLNQLRRMVDLEDSAPHLVEELHAQTLAVIGHQVRALEAARMAFDSTERNNDLESCRRWLAACTQAVREAGNTFYEYLYTVSRIVDVVELLQKESGASWANITIRDLTICHLSFQSTTFALMDGWQELAGRVSSLSTTARSTSVGQQLFFPAQHQP